MSQQKDQHHRLYPRNYIFVYPLIHHPLMATVSINPSGREAKMPSGLLEAPFAGEAGGAPHGRGTGWPGSCSMGSCPPGDGEGDPAAGTAALVGLWCLPLLEGHLQEQEVRQRMKRLALVTYPSPHLTFSWYFLQTIWIASLTLAGKKLLIIEYNQCK